MDINVRSNGQGFGFGTLWTNFEFLLLFDDIPSEPTPQVPIRSETAHKSIRVHFKNNTDHHLEIYWITYNKTLFHQGSLEPHKSTSVGTFPSHPFLISFPLESIQPETNEQDEKESTASESDDEEIIFFDPTKCIAVYVPHSEEGIQTICLNDGLLTNNDENETCSFAIDVSRSMKPDESKEESVDQNPEYEVHELCGFTLMIEERLLEQYPATMHFLFEDLSVICEQIEPQILDIIQQETKIWVNESYTYDGESPDASMCFHPHEKWLVNHGNLAEKARSVEMYRIVDYIRERGFMPKVLLHELTHAYHWYIGYGHPEVIECYQHACDNELYKNIAYVLSSERRDAYALTNQMEYFAEISEAFFGLNDFFPFNRDELEEYDPRGFELCQKLWSLTEEELAIERENRVEDGGVRSKDEDESDIGDVE